VHSSERDNEKPLPQSVVSDMFSQHMVHMEKRIESAKDVLISDMHYVMALQEKRIERAKDVFSNERARKHWFAIFSKVSFVGCDYFIICVSLFL
jgi:hypothetical protein